MCHGIKPCDGAGREELGRTAEVKVQVGRTLGVMSRMAARRDETAVKYVLIGVGQGERCRFSMGVAAARQARDERMRKEICMVEVFWMFRVQGRSGRVKVEGVRPKAGD